MIRETYVIVAFALGAGLLLIALNSVMCFADIFGSALVHFGSGF